MGCRLIMKPVHVNDDDNDIHNNNNNNYYTGVLPLLVLQAAHILLLGVARQEPGGTNVLLQNIEWMSPFLCPLHL